MQGCWWVSSTVKSGCQILLPHPMFDEDAVCHKKQLVIVISTSAQGDDLRTVLTVITDANFKNRACNATRLVMLVHIQSARIDSLRNSEISFCRDDNLALQLINNGVVCCCASTRCQAQLTPLNRLDADKTDPTKGFHNL
jgi:hypothetical protein